MPRDYRALPYDAVRRRDRAVTDDDWIEELLYRSPVGILATIDGDQPFINSNLFAYEATTRSIYMHTAINGRTRANVEANPRVTFHVQEMGRLLPAGTAPDFSVEYAGVTIFGTAHILDDEREAERALQLCLDKYFPHLRPDEHYVGITPQDLKRTSVFRIHVDMWIGKKKEVEDAFPGAFYYGDTPARDACLS